MFALSPAISLHPFIDLQMQQLCTVQPLQLLLLVLNIYVAVALNNVI